MTELSNALEKVSAVTTGAALFSGLGLMVSKYNTLYPYTENAVSLSVYGTLGVTIFSGLWYTFRKDNASN